MKHNIHLPRAYWNHTEGRRGNAVKKVSTETRVKIAAQMEEGRKYVDIPDRNFFIEGDFVCSATMNGVKQIDRWKKWGDTQNTIARELALRIKKIDSPILACQASIQQLEQLVLIYAGDPKIRTALKEIKSKYLEFLEMIENGDMNEYLEETAREFYKEFQEKIGLRGKAEELIHKFSWSGEEKYKNWEYCCHSWMIVVCIIGMIK